MAPTINEKYAALRGTTGGFDYMRVALALWVVALHGYILTYPEDRIALWTSLARLLAVPVLPMFFALSGFLIAGSLLRAPTIRTFLTYRGIRLLPALAVEVTLSALVLGPLLTAVPLAQYFTSPDFRAYFLNIVGSIHFQLPGVFTGPENYSRPGIVNLSLWTIPYELECYLSLVLLWAAGIFHRRWLFLAIAVAFILWGSMHTLRVPFSRLAGVGPVDGRALVVAFLCGCTIRLFGDRIRLSRARFLIALVASCVLLRFYQTQYLALFPAAYVTVFLGMLNPPRQKLILSGDYSYGIYLFAFPIQQTYFLLFPGHASYTLQMLFSLPLVIAYANASWWFVEKPILARKRLAAEWVEHVWQLLLRLVLFERWSGRLAAAHARVLGASPPRT